MNMAMIMHARTAVLATATATATALVAVLFPNFSYAQSQYPSRSIKLIVPFPPGGAPDVLARHIGERLGPALGQTIVIENRSGANGNVAMESVGSSSPDGHTLLMGHDSMIAINPHLYSKMPINPLKDLTPVAMVAASTSFLLVVPTSLPVKNFQEFIAYAKAANPPLAYSSGGNGSLHHLAMETLKLRAGIDLMHVPYKGGAPAVAAAISGEVSAAISSSVTGSYVRAGKLRALAVTGSSRLPAFPDLPAIGEFYPGYQMSSWFGIFAPPGMPDAVLAKLRAEIPRVLETPEMRRRLHAAGEFVPFVMTPEEFSSRIHTDYDKFGKLVKQIGVRVD